MSSNSNIPNFRFPGFSEDWVKVKFKVFTFNSGKKNKQNLPLDRYSISNEKGFVPQSDQFDGGAGYLKDIDCSMYIIVPPKSFAYNPARINVGSIGYQDLGKDVIVSSLYEVFQTTDICYDPFLWHWFHSDVFHRMVLDVQEGGVRQYFYYDKLKECSIYLPSILEQKRIAECLTSIDDTISAQQKKVDALKDHKKGMMQQMFPAFGETTPNLRFPGFEGEWGYVNGNELFDPISNKNHNSDLPLLALTQDQGAVPRELINYNVIVSDKSVSGYKVVEVGDFIISLRSFQGGIEYSRYKGLCSPAYIVLRKKNESANSDFYRIFFKSYNYIQQLNSKLEGIRDGKMISYKQFSDIRIPFPSPEEQKKIAECLVAMDETIASEEKKLEALKDHKRGMMQKMFPNPNE